VLTLGTNKIMAYDIVSLALDTPRVIVLQMIWQLSWSQEPTNWTMQQAIIVFQRTPTGIVGFHRRQDHDIESNAARNLKSESGLRFVPTGSHGSEHNRMYFNIW